MAFKGRVNALRNKLRRRKKEGKGVVATAEVAEKVTSTTRLTTTSPTSKNDPPLFSVESIASRSCQGDRYQSNGTVATEETEVATEETEVAKEEIEESRDEEEETNGDGVEWDTTLTKQYEDARLKARKQCGDNESVWLRSHTLSKTNEMAMPESHVATQEQHQLWLQSHPLSENETMAMQQQHLNHREVDLERQQSQLSETSLQVLYRLVATGIDFTTETRDYGACNDDDDDDEDDDVDDVDDVDDDRDDSDECDDDKNRAQGTNIPCADSKVDATIVCDNDEVTQVSTSLSGLSLTRMSDYNDGEETAYLNRYACACFGMQRK